MSREGQREDIILYPTDAPAPREQIIEIREPMLGSDRARVILRPLSLDTLAEVIAAPGVAGERRRNELARKLVFGL